MIEIPHKVINWFQCSFAFISGNPTAKTATKKKNISFPKHTPNPSKNFKQNLETFGMKT